MGAKIVEDESHMLYECDLYEDIRAKLITRLNRSPPILNTHPNNPELTLFIDQQTLRTNLMNMLSPYTTSNINDNPADSYNIHHKPLSLKPTVLIEQKLNYRRSYIVNCMYFHLSRIRKTTKICTRIATSIRNSKYSHNKSRP